MRSLFYKKIKNIFYSSTIDELEAFVVIDKYP